MLHFAPSRDTMGAADFADLFMTEIFRRHGLPESFVSDRSPRFTSQFFTEICERKRGKGKRREKIKRKNAILMGHKCLSCGMHRLDGWLSIDHVMNLDIALEFYQQLRTHEEEEITSFQPHQTD
jgi:hypothetical protein